MLKQILDTLKNKATDGSGTQRQQGVRWAVSGMATLLPGQKLPALGMFVRGVRLLEAQWRDEHPEVGPGLRERIAASLAFYEATHQDKKNRTLHVIGIPMVVGGAFVARKMMNLSSSFDHRVVDGQDAARFIQAVRGLLESPAALLVH